MADSKLHDAFDGWNYLTVGLKVGLNALGATKYADAFSSRPDASPDFTVVSFGYSRNQSLFGPWSAYGRVSGQFASGPLLSSQSYFLGDAAFGPGYYSGDNGVAGSLELRFSQTTNWQFMKSYQIYSFLDAGTVWNGEFEQRASLSSAGAGVRFEFANDWRGSIAVAVPVSYSSKSDEFYGTRFLFSLSKSFKLCPSREGMMCSERGS